jgi:hypothetical protein
MKKYMQVEGHSHLVREESSTAIVNTDINAYYLAKKRKEAYRTQVNEINTLKNEVTEIKQLLSQLVDKLNG